MGTLLLRPHQLGLFFLLALAPTCSAQFGGGGYTPPAPACPNFKCPSGMKPAGNSDHQLWSYGCKDSGINFLSMGNFDPNNPLGGMKQGKDVDKCCVEKDICRQTCGTTAFQCHNEYWACTKKTCKGDQNCEMSVMVGSFQSEPDDDEISTCSAPPPAICDQAEVTRVTEGTSESGFDDDHDNDQSGTNLTSAVVVAETAAAPLAFNVQPFDNGMHRASGGRWHSAEDNRTLVDAQLRSSLDKIFEDEQFWAEISCEIGTGHLELRSSMDWLQKCSSSVLAQSQRISKMDKTELLEEVSSQDTHALDGLLENKQLWEEIPSEISHQDPKLQSCMRWVSSKMIGSGNTEFSL